MMKLSFSTRCETVVAVPMFSLLGLGGIVTIMCEHPHTYGRAYHQRAKVVQVFREKVHHTRRIEM